MRNQVRRARRAAAVALIVASLTALPSVASDTDLADPKDSNGRFDIVAVELAHDAESTRWRTRMARSWNLKQAWDAGYVFVFFDTKGDEDADFYALIRSTGKRLRAALYKDNATGKDPLVSNLPARKSAAATAQVTMKLAKVQIASSRTEWFWSVRTLWTSPVCPRVCIDFAPDDGAIAQPVEPEESSEPAEPLPRDEPIEATPDPVDVDLPAIVRTGAAATGPSPEPE